MQQREGVEMKENEIRCQRNGSLEKVQIKNESFLLIVLLSGELDFYMGESLILAESPCCICFDESEDPKFGNVEGAEYFCIYFRPEYLNATMTFEFLRSCSFEDVALVHDSFLLFPFQEKSFRVPFGEEQFFEMQQACVNLNEEMKKDRDLNWHYRCRSYFMEILLCLEKMTDITKRLCAEEATVRVITNKKVKAAIKYVATYYPERIGLKDIADSCGLNHTTLTALMKQEMGVTVMEYLRYYRMRTSKQLLVASELTVKEIARSCGFKSEAHYCRIFKKRCGRTPEEYRQKERKKREFREERVWRGKVF